MRPTLPLLLVVSVVAVEARAWAAPTERRLHVASVEASSFLVNDWNQFQENYLPLYIGDDDPKTAWTDGVKGEGVGEWLRIKTTPMAGATRVRLRLRNGYQKTSKLFAANARAKAVTVVLLPGGKTVDVELADKEDWQEVVAEQPAGPLEAVELRFKSVYAGKKYDDLCLSDAQVFVTATTPENPAFEKGRLDRLLQWKSERLAAAKLFKTANAKSLPVGPQYRVASSKEIGGGDRWEACEKTPSQSCFLAYELRRAQKDKLAGPAHAAALAKAIAAVKDGFKGLTPVQVVARDKRPLPAVDGLCTPNLNSCLEGSCQEAMQLPALGALGFLSTAGLSLLDVKSSPTVADALDAKPKECSLRDTVRTFGWALRGKPGADGVAPLEALFLVNCASLPDREGYSTVSEPQLLVFDAEGRLDLVAGPSYVSLLSWRPGPAGPMLAGGRRLGSGADLSIEETVVAAK